MPQEGQAAARPSPARAGEEVARRIRHLARPQFGWLVVLVLLAGFVLRLWGVAWDQGTHLHPDERFITMVETDIKVPHSLGQYFDSAESPLNPYNRKDGGFAYGTFPLFLTKITGEVLQHQDFFPLNLVKDGLAKAFAIKAPRWDGYDSIYLLGRVWSAIFATGTVLLVFLTGKLLYDRRVGLLAMLLMATAVLDIQLAHYFTVDSFLTFFAALTIYYCVRIAKLGRWSDFALAGLAYGLAAACKLSGVFLGPVIALAVVWRLWSPAAAFLRAKEAPAAAPPAEPPAGPEERGEGPDDVYPLLKPTLGFLLAIFVAFVAFRIAEPYAFTGPNVWNVGIAEEYAKDMEGLIGLQRGGNVPFMWEWVGRTPYLFSLKNMLLWGMGLPLGIAAWGGFLWAAWRLLRRREATNILLLVWITFYFLFWGRQFYQTMRYFLPIYPALVLLAAYALNELWQLACSQTLHDLLRRWAARAQPVVPVLLRATVVGVAVSTVLWALAFTNVYRRPLSRIEASAWMIDNLPAGSSIIHEEWDDAVPFSLPGKRADFNYIDVMPYGFDLSDPSSPLLDEIDQADYIVLSSNRAYASIPRAPAKWPETSNYYRLLLADKLPGFRLVRTFTSYPTIFGITINDDSAEGNFTVYDHPKVLLFEKTDEYSPEKFMAAVSNTCLQVPASQLVPTDAAQNALLMRPDDCQTQREGGTWTSIFDPGSFSNRFPLVTWILVIEVMSLALLPLGLLVFRSLPDRGYLLLKPLGLLVVSWLVWMGASLKLVHFTRGSITAALVLVVLLGVALGWRRRRELLTFLRQHWRGLLLSEALFLAAFLIFYWIRMLDPDLWHPFRGGEKPMDFAYLNAVTRSTTMPPYDPWFAGGYLNYYYFGQFMTATLIKLTGTLPEIGYNLAVPMYFALTVGAAYSICFNLAEATRRRLRWRPGFVRIGSTGPVLAGVLGAVLVAVVGNLQGLYQTANRFSAVSDWHVGHGIPLLSGLVGMLGGTWKVITEGGVKLPPFDYWEPSRMMPPQASITEFPFFTFLFADLHAHLMAIPFDVAILGTGLALVLAGSKGRGEDAPSGRRQPTSWLGVVVLGLLIGALRPINSWDYPPFLLLGMAAILIGEWTMAGRLSWPVVGRAALKAAALTVLSVAFFLPFWQNYHLSYKGFHASEETTPFHQFLGHFGLLLFGAMTLVAIFVWRAVRRRPGQAILLYVLTVIGLLIVVCLAMLFSDQSERLPITIKGLSASDFLGNLFSNDIPVVAFSLAVIAALLLLAGRELRGRRPDAPIRLFVLALIGLALTLAAGVDILTLDGDIARMNTVFKFYVHVWLLLAVACAFGIWYMLAVIRRSPTPKGPTRTGWDHIGMWRGVWVAALAILLLGSLIYTVSGTQARVSRSDRFDQYHGHSINGMEYMKYAEYGDEGGTDELIYDYEAIWWMRENVEGTPVIVEGQTPNYRWGSRFSIYTGLPTVIGWGWHQKQQRAGFDYMIDERESDLKEFYSSPSIDTAIDFLRKYRVSYVIVGQVERLYYPEEGIAKFAEMNGRELELVFENPKTQIYRVLSLPPLIPTGSPEN
jgi:YYY domain-containing protein